MSNARLRALLADPHRTRVQLVTVATWLGLAETADLAAGLADLDALHGFVLVIGRSAAARQPDLAPGACDHYDAETRAWAYRALIDACRGRDGLKLVRPDPSDPQYRLDDSREHTRAIRCGPVADGEGGEDNRVGELLNEFRLELGLAKGPPPAAESAAFAAYCRDYVNSAVAMHNGFDSYVIGLWERADREAPAVKDRVPGRSGACSGCRDRCRTRSPRSTSSCNRAAPAAELAPTMR